MKTHHQRPTSTAVLDVITESAPPFAGTTTKWTLRLTDRDSGRPVNDLVAGHDKFLHLIIASKDLAYFAHLHPEHQGGGDFTIDVNLPHAGDYHIYADFTREDTGQELARFEIRAEGEPRRDGDATLVPVSAVNGWLSASARPPDSKDTDPSENRLYRVDLMLTPSPPVTGDDVTLHFRIHDANRAPIHDLSPYLGALGHVVILSDDGEQFLHAHPIDGEEGHGEHRQGTSARGGPDVIFQTTFPHAGIYKIWVQFLRRGRVITASFVIETSAEADGSATLHEPESARQKEHHHAG